MNNISIKTRLFVLVGALLALCLASVTASLIAKRSDNTRLHGLYDDRIVPLGQLKAVADAYFIGIVDTAHKVRSGAMKPDEAFKALAEARSAAAEHWKAYRATFLVAEEVALVEKAEPLLRAADAAGVRLESIIKGGDAAALSAFVEREMYPSIDPLASVIDQLSRVQFNVAEAINRTSEAEYNFALWRDITISVLALVAASVMAWLLICSIVSGIGEAVRVADTVASGDLSTRIRVTRGDEAGQLLQALSRMNNNLVDIVGRVRGAADSIATGSSEIATGNADLSQRTEEQASNLQQTAASMEQLTATVKHNAESAREATRLATEASAVAAQGGEVVGRVVDTMQNIASSSTRIVDIIGVIDGIAFQTNILALNAAVEAARAGEQGRGFAVVASEVRSLAQRSAQAAKEIKSLIGESVEKVEAGTRLVADAGQTMDAIVQQVRRVSDLISEIGNASDEQSRGIDQIGDAVNQLDQVTQQNAALVEESAAAAESLKHQAAALAQTVATFRLAA